MRLRRKKPDVQVWSHWDQLVCRITWVARDPLCWKPRDWRSWLALRTWQWINSLPWPQDFRDAIDPSFAYERGYAAAWEEQLTKKEANSRLSMLVKLETALIQLADSAEAYREEADWRTASDLEMTIAHARGVLEDLGQVPHTPKPLAQYAPAALVDDRGVTFEEV